MNTFQILASGITDSTEFIGTLIFLTVGTLLMVLFIIFAGPKYDKKD